MTLDSIIMFVKKLLDVGLIWVITYFLLKNIRNNVKLTLLFKGIIIIVGIKILSDVLGLTSIGLLLDYIVAWGPLAIIIIFQPEIRMILEKLGRSQLLGRHKILTMDEREKMVYEIVASLEYFKKSKIGALIVIERNISLANFIEKSKPIYAQVTKELLISIFFPNTPLHDGGVIIQGDRISSAGAVFPISENMKISRKFGTRHRAALGISEEADCLVIVASEETGRISLVVDGEFNYNLSLDDMKILLLDELRPKKLLDEDEELPNIEEVGDF
ncbi:MAG: diadenylate cyclase CdaA [Bacilli bacterium]